MTMVTSIHLYDSKTWGEKLSDHCSFQLSSIKGTSLFQNKGLSSKLEMNAENKLRMKDFVLKCSLDFMLSF